jgi:hypothetical protein
MSDKRLTLSIPISWIRLGFIVLLVAAVVTPSAAIAAGRFTDDDGSVHEANIEWLATKGITLGCNPPDNDDYCPDEQVTRAQMATFMQRLVDFLGDPATGKVDDADLLDGNDAGAFATAGHTHDSRYVNESDHTTAAHDALNIDADTLDGRDITQVLPSATSWSMSDLPNDDFIHSESVTIPAGGGTLLMTGSVDYWNFGGAADHGVCGFYVDGAVVDGSVKFGSSAPPGGPGLCSTDAAAYVDAGTHTIHFWGIEFDDNPSLQPDDATFHVIVIPDD